MIIYSTKLTTSGQISHNFGPLYSANNYKSTLHPVIAYLRFWQKNICEYCDKIGHKDDAWIIRGPNLIPPFLIRNMHQLNDLHGDESTDTPQEWNSQPQAADFKSITPPSKVSPMVSSIMGRLNHHAIDNGDVEVPPS